MFEPGRPCVPADEYLELEARADRKSEYFDGEVFAMAGGTPEHNLIAANLIRSWETSSRSGHAGSIRAISG